MVRKSCPPFVLAHVEDVKGSGGRGHETSGIKLSLSSAAEPILRSWQRKVARLEVKFLRLMSLSGPRKASSLLHQT